ncbi:unnamed protein product, partial [Adineta steineri]
RDLNGAISYDTVRRWCNMIEKTGAIQLSVPPGPPRFIRTKQVIEKVKNRLKCKKKVSSRILAHELSISRTSVRRILRNDLQYHAYKMRVVPLLEGNNNENIVFRRKDVRHLWDVQLTKRSYMDSQSSGSR